MQCEEIFKPDGIAALGKYRFSGLMATKYFEYY